MNPKVSILCITFNQSEFIEQTLDSFLSQVTDFPYEIIIHDDCSTDGTTAIVERYAKKHPEKIRLYLENENQYSKHNFEFIKDMYINAKGEYIATCEGDDYWTDENKLQKQIDFMDSNSDYAICFHTTRVVYEKSKQKSYEYPDVKDEKWYTLEQLFTINYIPTASAVYRKQNYANFISDMMPGDWYTHLFHAQFGKIKFLDEEMSVYRKHEGSVFYDYDKERDRIWIKHGLDYAKFYKELLTIYKSKPVYTTIIKNLLYQHMDMIAGVDEIYKTNILDDILMTFPEELRPFINYQHIQIKTHIKEKDDLKSELLKAGDERHRYEVMVDRLEHELESLKSNHEAVINDLKYIKSTRMWRTRQKIGKMKSRIVKNKK